VDKEFAYPAPRYEVAVEQAPAGEEDGAGGGNVEVVVTARTLVRDLLLQADRLGPDAVCDTGLRTLLPGESLRLRVRHADRTDAEAVRAALFCVEPA
jgi:beta-mannosidase